MLFNIADAFFLLFCQLAQVVKHVLRHLHKAILQRFCPLCIGCPVRVLGKMAAYRVLPVLGVGNAGALQYAAAGGMMSGRAAQLLTGHQLHLAQVQVIVHTLDGFCLVGVKALFQHKFQRAAVGMVGHFLYCLQHGGRDCLHAAFHRLRRLIAQLFHQVGARRFCQRGGTFAVCLGQCRLHIQENFRQHLVRAGNRQRNLHLCRGQEHHLPQGLPEPSDKVQLLRLPGVAFGQGDHGKPGFRTGAPANFGNHIRQDVHDLAVVPQLLLIVFALRLRREGEQHRQLLAGRAALCKIGYQHAFGKRGSQARRRGKQNNIRLHPAQRPGIVVQDNGDTGCLCLALHSLRLGSNAQHLLCLFVSQQL